MCSGGKKKSSRRLLPFCCDHRVVNVRYEQLHNNNFELHLIKIQKLLLFFFFLPLVIWSEAFMCSQFRIVYNQKKDTP